MREHNSAQASKGQDILSAWREGITDAARSPELVREVGGRERELLPRFAEHYEKLRALPRRARRAMQRKWKQSLAGVALIMALGAAPAAAATFNIPCPGGVGNNAALIQAINNANNETANPGADTINLVANCTHTLTAVNDFYGAPTGLPLVTSEITIAGNGGTIRRSSGTGTPNFRIFAIGGGGNLTLQQTTVSGGKTSTIGEGGGGVYVYLGALNLNSSTISGNSTSGNRSPGGGVYNYGGNLAVTDSTISGNSTTGSRSSGGGVFNNGGITVTNSTISGNSSVSSGGGLYNSLFRTMTLTNSTVSGNNTSFRGGGVHNRGTVILTNSTVSDNNASIGGGLYNLGTMSLTSSTVSGNSASIGGGLYNLGTMSLTSSTVSGNSASFGGGLYNLGTMSLTSSTVSGNSASIGGGLLNASIYITLDRTLVSGNAAPNSAEIFFQGGVADAANNYNLFGHSGLTNAQAFNYFTPGTTDITATSNGTMPTALTSILNTTLQNNGGPTQTHALVGGSPAVDAVTDGSCPPPATDQRGVTRPQGAACDIGAFELEPTTTCNGLTATIVGTPGNNTITGTNGADVIAGLGGNDTINGLGGNDVVCGGDGRDTINGGNGRDSLFGERSNDILNGGDSNDRLFGGGGNDTISGGNGDDQMQGGNNTDSCDGGAGNNTASGCETTMNVP